MPARRLLSLSVAASIGLVPSAMQCQTAHSARRGVASGAASPATAAQIRRLEAAWVAAFVKRDTAALGRVLSPEYVEVGPDGAEDRRADALQDVASGRLKYTSIQLGDITVRQYGVVAIAMGAATQAGSYDGKDISGSVRFTDVFLRRHGEWRAVNSQLTMVAK